MRVGIFGGTFDPVHLGHLILAEQCREQAQLDHVLFVPAARPPHKQEMPLTHFDKRVEMLQLALSGNPAFRIEELEKDRLGPSYTIDTLRALHERAPTAELFLLLGSDSLHDLPLWYDPARILQYAGVLVVPRPGWDIFSGEELRARAKVPLEVPVRLQGIVSPLVAISSRDLRRRVAAGQTIRYMVPRAVEAYIADKKLYQPA